MNKQNYFALFFKVFSYICLYMQYNQDEIKKLIVAKAKCKASLLFFTRYFFKKRFNKKFKVNNEGYINHHKVICDTLEKVVKGEITRLIINIAPRYGKTEIAVKNFIAWALANNPAARFIHLSYSDTLALDNSSEIKDIVLSDEYQQLFDVKVRKDSKSNKKWTTEQKGGVYATSTGGQVTGFGAGNIEDYVVNEEDELAAFLEYIDNFGGAIVVDDAIKPEDADSKILRDKINQKFDSTIRNRVNSKNTPIIIIMQRLHDDDLCGFVTTKEPDDWHELILPCILTDEEGEQHALWEFKETLEDLEKERKYNEVVFERQKMQKPMPAKGLAFPKSELSYFKKSDIDITDEDIYCTSAIDTADKGADDYAHVFGFTKNGKTYIYDVIYNDEDLDKNKPRTFEKLDFYKPENTIIETNKEGSIYFGVIEDGFKEGNVDGKFNTTQKDVRIRNMQGYIKHHFVFLSPDQYAYGSEYWKFMDILTSYLKTSTKEQRDDAPDVLALMAKYMISLGLLKA